MKESEFYATMLVSFSAVAISWAIGYVGAYFIFNWMNKRKCKKLMTK